MHCFTHSHIQSFSFVPSRSRKFPAFRIFSPSFALWTLNAKSFISFAWRFHELPRPVANNVLIPRGKYHVATYRRIRIVCARVTRSRYMMEEETRSFLQFAFMTFISMWPITKLIWEKNMTYILNIFFIICIFAYT